MTRKGFFLPLYLILLGILVLIGYFALQALSKPPSSKTQEITDSFLKYPNSKNWQIKNDKSPCYFNYKCAPPSVIVFESGDSWPAIYGWYVQNSSTVGWTTNSEVLTSIPTSLTLNKTLDENTNCEADLSKYDPTLLERIKGVQENTKYIFTVSCNL